MQWLGGNFMVAKALEDSTVQKKAGMQKTSSASQKENS